MYKKSPVIHHGTPAWRWNRRGRYTRAGVRGCNQYFTGPTSPVRVCVGIACIVPLHLPNDPTPTCGGAGVFFRVVFINQRSPRIRMFSRLNLLCVARVFPCVTAWLTALFSPSVPAPQPPVTVTVPPPLYRHIHSITATTATATNSCGCNSHLITGVPPTDLLLFLSHSVIKHL